MSCRCTKHRGRFWCQGKHPAGLAGIFSMVILFFTSPVLVPVATMPGGLQAFAKANPITDITGALRALVPPPVR